MPWSLGAGDQALMFSRSGVARSGATRSGYFNQTYVLVVAGVDRSSNAIRHTTLIRKTQGVTTRSTASVDVYGFDVSEGDPIVIASGSASKRLFAGTVLRVSQKAIKAHVYSSLDLTDWRRQFDRQLVLARYTGPQSGSLVVLDIVSRYCPGFTTNNVQLGAPSVGPIDFTDATPTACIQRICELMGNGWRHRIDEDRDVHLYVTEAGQNPATITNAALLAGVDNVVASVDGTDRCSRAKVTGGGSEAAVYTAAGSVSIDVQECSWYSAGMLRIGQQVVTYTGVSASSGPGTLTGIPATGAYALADDVPVGTPVNLYTVEDDATLAAEFATKDGFGDGYYDKAASDGRLGLSGVVALAQSMISGGESRKGSYKSYDRFADVGRDQEFNYAHRGLVFTVPITGVVIKRAAQEQWERQVTYDDAAAPVDAPAAIRAVASGLLKT